jgi:hypothetical protein
MAGLGSTPGSLGRAQQQSLRQSPLWFLRTWDTEEARATHLRFLAGEVPKGTYRV